MQLRKLTAHRMFYYIHLYDDIVFENYYNFVYIKSITYNICIASMTRKPPVPFGH